MEKLVPDPILKNEHWAFLWINSLNFFTVCFYRVVSWELLKYIDTKLQSNCFHLILSFFKKIKRDLELCTLPHFLHNFWRKILLLLSSVDRPNFIVWLSLLCEILGNMCIGIACKPGCDVMDFEVSLIFQIKLFFLHDQNDVRKTYYLEDKKSF